MAIGISFIGDKDDTDVDVISMMVASKVFVSMILISEDMLPIFVVSGVAVSMISTSEVLSSSILVEADQGLVDTHRREGMPRLPLQSR